MMNIRYLRLSTITIPDMGWCDTVEVQFNFMNKVICSKANQMGIDSGKREDALQVGF